MTEHFVDYLFEEYQGDARHVRRVAGWLGLLALGIEKKKVTWKPSHSRQLVFEVNNMRYKARYRHGIGSSGGGIEFVEVEKAPGSPDVRVARQILSLSDAEAFYRSPSF
jgi:hypothetical protein